MKTVKVMRNPTGFTAHHGEGWRVFSTFNKKRVTINFSTQVKEGKIIEYYASLQCDPVYGGGVVICVTVCQGKGQTSLEALLDLEKEMAEKLGWKVKYINMDRQWMMDEEEKAYIEDGELIFFKDHDWLKKDEWVIATNPELSTAEEAIYIKDLGTPTEERKTGKTKVLPIIWY